MSEQQSFMSTLDEEHKEKLQKELDTMEPQLREKVEKFYHDLQNMKEADFDLLLADCGDILKTEPDLPQVEYLQAHLLFQKDDRSSLKKASKILKALRKKEPDNKDVRLLSGRVYFHMDRYLEARDAFAKVCPLDPYEPYIYLEYGISLVKLGRPEEGLYWYHQDMQEFKNTGNTGRNIVESLDLNLSFRNAIATDIQRKESCLGEDLDLYKQFLLKADTSDEDMQQMISSLVVEMAGELSGKWLREYFRDFVTFLEEHQILHGSHQLAVISAYPSLESYEMHDDDRVSQFVIDYCYCMNHAALEQQLKEVGGDLYEDVDPQAASEDRYHREVDSLMYQWYMAGYSKDHREELDHVRQNYPHAGKLIEECLHSLEEDASWPDKLVDRIAECDREHDFPSSREETLKYLKDEYQGAISERKNDTDDPQE